MILERARAGHTHTLDTWWNEVNTKGHLKKKNALASGNSKTTIKVPKIRRVKPVEQPVAPPPEPKKEAENQVQKAQPTALPMEAGDQMQTYIFAFMAFVLLLILLQFWQTRQLAASMRESVSQLAMNQVYMAADLKLIAAKIEAPIQGIGDIANDL